MLDPVRAAADRSVSRGCGFAALAIWVAMVALVAEPTLSLRIGALLASLTAAVLFVKAARAHRRPYRSTEIWLLLADAERPLPAVAQGMIPAVLSETLMRYARLATGLAAGLWAMTGMLALASG